MGTGGEVANVRVCKTCIREFNPRPVLQTGNKLPQQGPRDSVGTKGQKRSGELRTDH
jgi:hypothetical protein